MLMAVKMLQVFHPRADFFGVTAALLKFAL